MQEAVKFQRRYWGDRLREGDVLVSNHPQLAGGSHLPDITVITPVWNNGVIVFWVASRGHHADIGTSRPKSTGVVVQVSTLCGAVWHVMAWCGLVSYGLAWSAGGISPGSMPPLSKALQEEGAMIIASKLVDNGVFQVCAASLSRGPCLLLRDEMLLCDVDC